MERVEQCRLCGADLDNPAREDSLEIYGFRCRRCGEYKITREAFDDIPSRPAFLQAAARQEFEAGRRLTITTQNWEHLIAEHSNTNILRNVDKLLNHILRHCPRPGNTLEINTAKDYPIIDAADSGELFWHLENAVAAGYIQQVGSHFSLKAKGWDYLMGPAAGSAVPGRCFVAMSFDKDHEPIYTDALKPAVMEAGYDPVWMKDVLTNEDICHRMIVEIRKAQFVVADLTGLKAGVYFEAGFARGLGREVFWTTRVDEISKIHFDTNHYQHTVWETYDDLRRQLGEKIVAVLGYGPRKSAPGGR